MLYIIHGILNLIWVGYLKKKGNYPLRVILGILAITVLTSDIGEIVFNEFLEYYRFSSRFFVNEIKNNYSAMLISDALLLPLTAIIFCHYATKIKHWKIISIFTVFYFLLEVIYVFFGYLSYNKWNTMYSGILYLFVYIAYAFFAKSLLMPLHNRLLFWLKIVSFSYMVLAATGAILGDPVFELFLWRPGIFFELENDDRFSALGLSVAIGVIAATIFILVKKDKQKIFLGATTILAILFSWYANRQGWLIFNNHWNMFFHAVRYIILFWLIYIYGRWEQKFIRQIKKP